MGGAWRGERLHVDDDPERGPRAGEAHFTRRVWKRSVGMITAAAGRRRPGGKRRTSS